MITEVRNGVRYYPDREVCEKNAEGEREYQRRIVVMWRRQLFKCIVCDEPLKLEEATFEHENGRGMGGGFRNDAIVDGQGNPLNGVAHGRCNSEKGSRRGYATSQ